MRDDDWDIPAKEAFRGSGTSGCVGPMRLAVSYLSPTQTSPFYIYLTDIIASKGADLS